MQEKDYQNYDYIDIIVKKQSQQEIVDGYSSFLWQQISAKDDMRYSDLVHLSFKRNVNINNKDRLALLQVYYENALNKKAEIKLNKHSKSKTSICFLAFFSLLALVGIGVFIYFLKNVLSVVLGMAFALCIVAVDIVLAKKIGKKFIKENKDYILVLERVDEEIDCILKTADALANRKSIETKKGEDYEDK